MDYATEHTIRRAANFEAGNTMKRNAKKRIKRKLHCKRNRANRKTEKKK
jgi:hypothetical protein